MNIDSKEIGVGSLAGVATIILSLGIATGSGVAVLLFFLSPLPIMIAGLGWGSVSGAIAVLVAAAGIGFSANFHTAAFILLTTALPAATAAHWLTLSRPADEIGGPSDKLAWFPLSDVMFRLAIMTAIAFVTAGILVGYDQSYVTSVADQMIARIQEANPEFAFSDEGRNGFIATITNFIPLVQPAMWLLVLAGNLYAALAVTRSSGNLARPRDMWPISMRMPRIAIVALGIAIAATFVPGGFGLVGNVFAGALLAGFTLAGFAVFHMRIQGQPWQLLALVVVYCAVALTLVAAFPFTIWGMFALARNMPVSDNNKPGGKPPANQS